MRKQTKLVAVASAAALLAIGASMTSFAAAGWVEEDGTWYYYDSDGNRVEDEWKKSGDNWYWLDSEEDGAMAVDKLIEDDDNIYYVDSNGVMVKNTWVKVVNEDQDDEDDPAEYHYYYMQSSGKAYKNSSSSSLSKKTIDGKRYAFSDDGVMLYGWVTTEGDMANDESGWANDDTLYYFGSWEDGAMKTGWQKITVYDEEKEDDYDYWFAFRSNGRKRVQSTSNDSYTWKSNGKYYQFDDRGVMVYEWYLNNNTTNNASASNWNYFGSPEEGAKYAKGWFKVAPPNEDNTFLEITDTFAKSDSTDESERWYYADRDGLVAGEIKKIKGKYYGFWPEDTAKSGRMLVGLCALRMDGEKIVEVLADDMDADDLDDFLDSKGDFYADKDAGEFGIADESQSDNNIYLYYFGDSNDQDNDGAMRTGSTTIKLDGDNYQFYFKKSGGAESRGRGLNGIYDDDYIYRHGMKVKADSDEKYVLVYATENTGDDSAVVIEIDSADIRSGSTDYANAALKVETNKDSSTGKYADTVKVIAGFDKNCYLVNSSGKIQDGTLSAKKDGDDWYWYTCKGVGVMMYTSDKDLDDCSALDNSKWKDYDDSDDLYDHVAAIAID